MHRSWCTSRIFLGFWTSWSGSRYQPISVRIQIDVSMRQTVNELRFVFEPRNSHSKAANWSAFKKKNNFIENIPNHLCRSDLSSMATISTFHWNKINFRQDSVVYGYLELELEFGDLEFAYLSAFLGARNSIQTGQTHPSWPAPSFKHFWWNDRRQAVHFVVTHAIWQYQQNGSCFSFDFKNTNYYYFIFLLIKPIEIKTSECSTNVPWKCSLTIFGAKWLVLFVIQNNFKLYSFICPSKFHQFSICFENCPPTVRFSAIFCSAVNSHIYLFDFYPEHSVHNQEINDRSVKKARIHFDRQTTRSDTVRNLCNEIRGYRQNITQNHALEQFQMNRLTTMIL